MSECKHDFYFDGDGDLTCVHCNEIFSASYLTSAFSELHQLREQLQEAQTKLTLTEAELNRNFKAEIQAKEQLQEAQEREARMREALEKIANREGHPFSPEIEGPDEDGVYTVVGPGKPELTKQCAHWMRHIAQEALSTPPGPVEVIELHLYECGHRVGKPCPDKCPICELQAAQASYEQAENLLRIAISLMKENENAHDDDWNDLIVEAESFLKVIRK